MPFTGNVLTALHARYAGQVDRVIAGRILDARLAETAFFGCESASVRGLSPLGTSAAARWLGRHRFLSVSVEFKIDSVPSALCGCLRIQPSRRRRRTKPRLIVNCTKVRRDGVEHWARSCFSVRSVMSLPYMVQPLAIRLSALGKARVHRGPSSESSRSPGCRGGFPVRS